VETTFGNGGGSVQGGEAFVLGAGAADGTGLAGAVDDVSFFHGVLTQSEVDALVPEPSALGLLGLIGFGRRRKR